MASPLQRSYPYGKRKIMEAFPAALKALDMKVTGSRQSLGLIGFREGEKPVFYAHIVERENQSTVSIAPGMSCMKEQAQEQVPAPAIEQVMNTLERVLKEEE